MLSLTQSLSRLASWLEECLGAVEVWGLVGGLDSDRRETLHCRQNGKTWHSPW